MINRGLISGLVASFILVIPGVLPLAGCASASSDAPVRAPSDGPSPSIPIQVMKPDGAGPFPAVVIVHDCSGLGPRSSGAPARWAKVLLEQGYVALIPDSFSTRGHAQGVCVDPSPSRNEVSPWRRVRDASEALAYARSLSYVDGAHVGLMGGSHGGSATLATMVAAPGGAPGFAAAVALYPGCGTRYGEWRPGTAGVYKPRAPLLILVGEKDDWTPAEPCRQLAERLARGGLSRHGEDLPRRTPLLRQPRAASLRGGARELERAGRARRNHRGQSGSVGRQHSRGERVLRPAPQELSRSPRAPAHA